MKPIIAVDIDGVVADLHTEWLRRYNIDYNDTLSVSDINMWELSKIVKPECGSKIISYLEDSDIYTNVLPIKGALNGINLLKDIFNARIVWATSCVRGSRDQKLDWIKSNGFDKDAEDNFIDLHDKSLVRADLLIDDRDKNVLNFKSIGIIFDASYNKNFKWPINKRLHNWTDTERLIGTIYNCLRKAGYNKIDITEKINA